jgi:hypothetical protein
MNFYAVDTICPRCGERHLMIGGLMLEGGPTQAGSLAELYGNRQLMPNLARLLIDEVWCDTQGGYVSQPDRARADVVWIGPGSNIRRER